MRMKIDKNKLKYRIMAVVLTLSVLLSYVAVFVVDSHAAALSQYVETVNYYYISREDLQTVSFRLWDTGSGSDTPVRLGYYTTFEFTNKLGKGDVYRVHIYGDSYFSKNYYYRNMTPQDEELYPNGLSAGNGVSYLTVSQEPFADMYHFSSKQELDDYLSGKTDASTALNYDDVAFGTASYDSSVPSPDKLYIDSLSSTSVSAVWSYSNSSTSLDNVTYKVEVENFYVTTSLFNSIAKGWTGKTGESSWKFNGTIDECNRLKGMHTVESYLSAPTKILADEVLVSSNVTSGSGTMHSTNTFVCTPTDYSGQFASSGNAFFTGATNSHWAEYCGSQVTVTPYMTVDGVTKKGSTVVCRRFTSDMLNSIVGSTYTKVGTDGNGKEYIESTNRQDNTGASTGEYEKLDTDNVMTFIKNGFGILGNNGVLALAQTVFLGVPAYIWMLYGTLIAVTIIVIVFKITRGF